MKVLDGEAMSLAADHPDPAVGQVLLMAALGTADHDFFGGVVRQLGDASSQDGKVDERALNFMLSVVKGIRPRDQVETMLAAQMAAVHMATLTSARRLALADTLPQQDAAERAVNKLSRTYATQMEALRRYRFGAAQNVTVQHVSVSEGGQAIVGNVTQTAREPVPESDAQAPPAPTHSREPPMPIISEPQRRTVPVERSKSSTPARSKK
jgi:hypothetical protein